MAHVFRSNDNEVLERNRYNLKFTKPPPDYFKAGCWLVSRRFKLCSQQWELLVVFSGSFVNISILNITKRGSEHLYEVRAGFVGKSLKEIAVLRDMSREKNLTFRSKLDKKLLTDKDLCLFIEIRSKDKNIQKMKDRKEKTEADFREILLRGKDSDVTIQVKHKKFNCHRLILSARSPVFAAMMEHDMKEKSSGVVTIEDTDPTAFQDFLLYLYTANEDFVRWENITHLYNLADKYQVDDLKNVCIEDIKENIDENINSSDFCKFYLLSQLHNDLELSERIIQFFLANSKEIVRQENWLRFLSENPVESNILLTALADKSRKK